MTNTLDIMTIIIRVASSHLDNAPPCYSSNPLVAYALSTGAADPLSPSAYNELVAAAGDKLGFGPNTSLAELMENPVMVSTFWDRPGFRRFGPQAYEGQLVGGQMQWKARNRPVRYTSLVEWDGSDSLGEHISRDYMIRGTDPEHPRVLQGPQDAAIIRVMYTPKRPGIKGFDDVRTFRVEGTDLVQQPDGSLEPVETVTKYNLVAAAVYCNDHDSRSFSKIRLFDTWGRADERPLYGKRFAMAKCNYYSDDWRIGEKGDPHGYMLLYVRSNVELLPVTEVPVVESNPAAMFSSMFAPGNGIVSMQFDEAETRRP
ncbi:uncharacterized protein B0T23DRAFT_407854 [Neurospora hispaniola]|uniref:Uncharacterized protein n=1 Tax=Neurospora hispaniola TaxID=588809 RepID=A0AAJ0HZJ8_9PEZI|nr:hypothetical protein B0T23DRAFT_407854 [Neurospora hispaniola]